MVMNALEIFIAQKNKKLGFLCVLFSVYIILILLIFRVHYVIGRSRITRDIPIAIMFGITTYMVVSRISERLDTLCYNIIVKTILKGIILKHFYKKKQTRRKHSSEELQQHSVPSQTIHTPILNRVEN